MADQMTTDEMEPSVFPLPPKDARLLLDMVSKAMVASVRSGAGSVEGEAEADRMYCAIDSLVFGAFEDSAQAKLSFAEIEERESSSLESVRDPGYARVAADVEGVGLRRAG